MSKFWKIESSSGFFGRLLNLLSNTYSWFFIRLLKYFHASVTLSSCFSATFLVSNCRIKSFLAFITCQSRWYTILEIFESRKRSLPIAMVNWTKLSPWVDDGAGVKRRTLSKVLKHLHGTPCNGVGGVVHLAVLCPRLSSWRTYCSIFPACALGLDKPRETGHKCSVCLCQLVCFPRLGNAHPRMSAVRLTMNPPVLQTAQQVISAVSRCYGLRNP